VLFQPARPLIWSAMAYFATGVASALVSNPIAAHGAQAMIRITALAIGGLVFGAHVRHEFLILGNTPRRTAVRVSWAAGLGGLALAAYMVVYNLVVRSRSFGSVALVLIVWPLLAAVLAYIPAIMAAKGVVLWRNRRQTP